MSKPDASDLNYTPFEAGPIIPGYDPHPYHRADLVRIHDGDTAWFRLYFEAGVSCEVAVRTEGFNSPELSGPHHDQAVKATKAFAELLYQGPIWVRLTGAVTFARYVGQITVVVKDRPIDVATWLTDLGFNVIQGQ